MSRPFITVTGTDGTPRHIRADLVGIVAAIPNDYAGGRDMARLELVGVEYSVPVNETPAEVLRRIAEAENAPG